MTSRGWEVVEEESYTIAVAQLGGADYVDRAISPLWKGLQRNPLGFRKVPGFRYLYLAKTKLAIHRDGEIILAMRFWFRADEDARKVHLLYADICPPEELDASDDPWGEPVEW